MHADRVPQSARQNICRIHTRYLHSFRHLPSTPGLPHWCGRDQIHRSGRSTLGWKLGRSCVPWQIGWRITPLVFAPECCGSGGVASTRSSPNTITVVVNDPLVPRLACTNLYWHPFASQTFYAKTIQKEPAGKVVLLASDTH